ncbi:MULTISPECIES: hypothetical protein [unclassified Capnocytophaga]|jgi:hypothetical protein|uniref:hypothetical protein n=1 Tax=unclassified Capnocytophaga TaxID=2640652 RepID=UPI000202ED74|nr:MULTISPECIES: hypothetical protein [unclassified Capnocytophaga]EGD33132.1 hypothetical protein HMPREF9071_2325 [Capnocytophaga sp. oral taxon 338 str. F0234]MEB3005394.1 hypothetical protein [Capnocytophaga sp. G2]
MALSELKETAKNLPNEVESTIDSYTEYYKLYIFRIIAKSAAGLVSLFVVGLFALVIAFFLACASAFAIGQWLGSDALGFLIMGVIFLIGLLIIYRFRRFLIHKPILGKLSEIYFKE